MLLFKKCKPLFSFLILTGTLNFTSPIYADAWYSTGRLTIIQLLVLDNSLEIMLEGNSSCNRVFRLGSNQKNYSVKSSALLAAYYAGHSISVNYHGNLDDCNTPLKMFKVHPPA